MFRQQDIIATTGAPALVRRWKLTVLLPAALALLAAFAWLGTRGTEANGSPLSVSAGGDHTCAINGVGNVQCWGSNNTGQLGINNNTGPTTCGFFSIPCALVPQNVCGGASCSPSTLSGVAAVSSGYSHTCVLTTGGGVKCWGDNTFGQLGDGTTTERDTPDNVSGLTSGVAAISAGGVQTCALIASDLSVRCWGDNEYGELGIGNATGPNTCTFGACATTPREVCTTCTFEFEVYLTGVAAISAGGGLGHTCAVLQNGHVKCWGANDKGQLGDGGDTGPGSCLGVACSVVPDDVYYGSGEFPPQLTGADGITAGGYAHSCAHRTTGGIVCWGRNDVGQLGDGTTTERDTATDVSGLTSGATSVEAGSAHTCARTAAGAFKCWGHNNIGQLGDNSFADRHTPVDVYLLTSGGVAISAGDVHTCGVVASSGVSSLKCWGGNGDGRLGWGGTANAVVPTAVSGLTAKPTPTATPTPGPTPGPFRLYCPASPNPSPPSLSQPGCEGVTVTGTLSVTITSLGDLTCPIGGTMYVARFQNPLAPSDSNGNGRRDTFAQILSMHLEGYCGGVYPIVMTQSPSKPSYGYIEETTGQTPGFFPATTTFSVYFLVHDVTGNRDIHNDAAAVLQCAGAMQVPIIGCTFNMIASIAGAISVASNPSGVPLFDQNGVPVGKGAGDLTPGSVDSDADGCPDVKEQQTAVGSQTSGGRRDYLNPWDYFNPEKLSTPHTQTVADILKVISQFGKNQGNPAYTNTTDRTGILGGYPWSLGPADGMQTVADILAAIKQFTHNCS
jgi:alpha-tubulin suppressor-like RCC1 family protein